MMILLFICGVLTTVRGYVFTTCLLNVRKKPLALQHSFVLFWSKRGFSGCGGRARRSHDGKAHGALKSSGGGGGSKPLCVRDARTHAHPKDTHTRRSVSNAHMSSV